MKIFNLSVCCFILSFATAGRLSGDDLANDESAAENSAPYQKPTAAELRRQLTSIQFRVTQNEDTEPAFRNRYWSNKAAGNYDCVVCGQALFNSETKFKSGTGWPSFYQPIEASAIESKTDYHMLYPRTEIHCSRCKAHLGHVFSDGPPPTGQRYCMNSASLEFKPAKSAVPTAKSAVESAVKSAVPTAKP